MGLKPNFQRVAFASLFLSVASAFATDECIKSRRVFSEPSAYSTCAITLRLTDQKTGKPVTLTEKYPASTLSEAQCGRFCDQYRSRLSTLDALKNGNEFNETLGNTNTVRLFGIEDGAPGHGQAFGAFSELILNFDFIEKLNQRNIDLGGGGFNHTSAMLFSFGILNSVYDPYRREASHNRIVLRTADYDSATSFSVLNVIEKSEDRKQHIELAWKSLKCGGTAYFKIYEGGKLETPGTFQMRQPTQYYLNSIQQVFGTTNVTLKDSFKLIFAKKECS